VKPADRLDAADRIEHRIGRLLVDIAGICARSPGQDAARVGRGVEDGDAFRMREISISSALLCEIIRKSDT